MNSLVIVESGAKATKIKGYLDANFKDQSWQVEACLGHIRDLPDDETAVNPEIWTELKWKETPKGKKTIKALRKVCKEIDTLYLATDLIEKEKLLLGIYIAILKRRNCLRMLM